MAVFCPGQSTIAIVGAYVDGGVDLLMPGGEPTTLNLVVEQPVIVDLLLKHEPGSGRVEPKLYDAMVEKAFAKHRKLFLAQWFESK